ncbi:MAG TPA: hypothetical protein DD426_06785 [Clostridiaceae bacterium]|nr:hypothetical protein [Clostridiaceae bacterium]
MKDDRVLNIRVQSVADSWMNLHSSKSMLYDVLETFMDFLMVYPLFAIVLYAIIKDDSYIFQGYAAIAGVMVMVLLRRFVHNNLLHYLSYLPILAAAYYFGGPTAEKCFILPLLFTMMCVSIAKRNRKFVTFRKLSYMIAPSVIFMILYIISVANNFYSLQYLIIIHFALFTGICIIYIHISRTKTLMKWERTTSKEDKRKINGVSLKFIAVFSMFLAIVFILFYMENFFMQADKSILMYIGSLFSASPKPRQPEKIISEAPQKDIGIPDALKNIKGGNSAVGAVIAMILKMIFGGLMIAAALALVIFLGRALYKKIRELVFGKVEYAEEKESLFKIDDVVENIKEKISSVKRQYKSLVDNSNNKKIRRIYYKLVKSNKKSDTKIEPSDTAIVIENKILKDSKRDIDEATAIYQKARYGKLECTKGELSAIKNFKPKEL